MHKDIGQDRLRNPGEVGIYPFMIEFHLVEVNPDAFIPGAAVTTTDPGTFFIDTAVSGSKIQMAAIPVAIVTNKIGTAQIPFNLGRFQLRNVEGEVESAAC